MKKEAKGPMIVAGFIGFVIVLGLFLGLIIQALWNQTVAPLFDVSPIGYWQSVGIFILAKIMFGLGSGSGPSKKFRRKMKGKSDDQELRDQELSSQAFREYWETEGKNAFEAFKTEKQRPDLSS